MRFSTVQTTIEACLVAVLALVAGCAIETEDALVEFDPERDLDLGPTPDLPEFGFDVPDESTEASDPDPALVLQSALPNPIDSQTRLSFAVPAGGARVVLAVYGIDGRRVKLLVDEVLEDGEYSAFWYGRDDRGLAVPSGVYIVNLRRGSVVKNRKVLLVR